MSDEGIHLEALGRRAYEAHGEALQKPVTPWEDLPRPEQLAWAVAAQVAGQNYPAPIVVEVSFKVTHEGAPIKAVFLAQDTVEGIQALVADFQERLVEVLKR